MAEEDPAADGPWTVPDPAVVCSAVHDRTDAARDRDEALAAVAATAVDLVPGAGWASIARRDAGSFRTLSATAPEVAALDALQGDLDAGPGIDAVTHRRLVRTDDLRADPRWPDDLRRTAADAGVVSVLALPLLLDEADAVVGLTVCSPWASAFDEGAERTAGLIVRCGAHAVAAAAARDEVVQLTRALRNSRDIGIAVGILMATERITRERAFERLRRVSQNSNRKLRDIALEVGETGRLPAPDPVTR